MIHALNTLDDYLARLERLLLTVVSGAMTLILMAQVILRYAFSHPLFWAEEVSVQLLVFMTQSPYIFLLLVNGAIIVLGMFLETISVMIIIVPILLPTVENMGIDLIHFGVIVSLGTVVGLATPPVGPGLYIAMLHTATPIKEIIRSMIPFLMAIGFAMAIINLFPILSLWLPGLFGLL